jgi:hypothetical protein
MIRMLCRNKVADFAQWKSAFDSHAEAQAAAGLKLESLWRSIEYPNEVFFLFSVADLEQARAFTSAVAPAEAAKKYGVLEGDIWYVE